MIAHVERYLSIRRALGFQLLDMARRLRRFAAFAEDRGDTLVLVATVIAWAGLAPTPHARHIRFRDAAVFARFVHGEDPRHQVPVGDPFPNRWVRPVPHIYTTDEVTKMIAAVPRLKAKYPLQHAIVATLIGLLAATGLRVSEALRLRFEDVWEDGQLVIRQTKFRKDRLVPMHPTTATALSDYLHERRRSAGTNDHVFVSGAGVALPYVTFLVWFRKVRIAAGVLGRPGGQTPRIHDLRHTFATRALQRCASEPGAVSTHHLALSTYLGHGAAKNTYWYLEATPELLSGMAADAVTLVWEGRP